MKKYFIVTTLILCLSMILYLSGCTNSSTPSYNQPSYTQSQTQQPTATTARTSRPTSIPTSRITMENFEKISKGMTYNQVVSILGEGELQVSGSTDMYVWSPSGAGTISVVFKNGIVISKSQMGL